MRKDPYHLVKVSKRVYAELKKRLEPDNRGEYKIPSMNEFIERVLWDYAQGKFTRAGSARQEDREPLDVAEISGHVQEDQPESGEEGHGAASENKNDGKKIHRRHGR